jgi:hypothetical protein
LTISACKNASDSAALANTGVSEKIILRHRFQNNN